MTEQVALLAIIAVCSGLALFGFLLWVTEQSQRSNQPEGNQHEESARRQSSEP